MAIRRGYVARGRCAVCGDPDVIAAIVDVSAPLVVRWICQADKRTALEAQRAEEARRAAAATQATYDAERTTALRAIAELPELVQAELRAVAARGPAGIRLAPSAPLFTMQLVRAFRAHCAR